MLDRAWLNHRLRDYPRRTIASSGLREAAVLVPLYTVDGEDRLLFTVRTAHLPHHAGEISFPGGGRDAGDLDLRTTALRETEEELGITADAVTLHGRLDDFTSIYGYHVVPYVGTVPQPQPQRFDRNEIAQVFSAPLDHFREPGVHHVEDWTHKGRHHLVDFYRYGNHLIWGLTGAILRQLLEETADAPE